MLVVTKQLDPGVYTFTARVTDARGAKSNETSPLSISVQSKFVSGLINIVLKYLSVAILTLLTLGGIVGAGAYVWFKIPRAIRRMRQEAQEAEKMLEKSFNILRKDIDTHIARLKAAKDKRKLTVEEILFLEEFEKNLTEAEDIITKEMKDISQDK